MFYNDSVGMVRAIVPPTEYENRYGDSRCLDYPWRLKLGYLIEVLKNIPYTRTFFLLRLLH